MKRTIVIAGLLIVIGVLGVLAYLQFAPNMQVSPTPTQTSQPTTEPVVIPTATPDQTAGWKTFEDPFGRYTIKYPPGWYVIAAQDGSLGKATFITSFDLESQFSNPKTSEAVVPKGEFMIALGLETAEVIKTENLSEWVNEHYTKIVQIKEISEFSVGNLDGVRLKADAFGEGEAELFFFSVADGVFFIQGEPITPENATLLHNIVSTLNIGN